MEIEEGVICLDQSETEKYFEWIIIIYITSKANKSGNN